MRADIPAGCVKSDAVSTQRIIVSRLYWIGPATVVTSVAAVTAVRLIAAAILGPLPRFSERLLSSDEPEVITAVLVSMAVLVFLVCVRLAADPVSTYRRIALAALLISFLPNLAAGQLLRPAVDWPSMIALMVMHVAAWAVTVSMLTRLTTFMNVMGR